MISQPFAELIRTACIKAALIQDNVARRTDRPQIQ